MLSKTHLLLQIGEILQEHLPGITDIKLMGEMIICSTDRNVGGATIEIKVNQMTAADFQDAETLIDSQLGQLRP